MTKATAKAQLGLLDEAQDDVRLLNENFSEIMDNLETYLGTLILDKSLIDEIIEGKKSWGGVVA